MAREETLDYRIRCIVRTERSVRCSAGWNLRDGHDSYRLLLTFVIEVEECFVLHNRPAQGGAVLVVVEWRLGLADRIEGVARIQSIVAEIFSRGSVQGVGATLGHTADHCCCTAAGLRLEEWKHIYL